MRMNCYISYINIIALMTGAHVYIPFSGMRNYEREELEYVMNLQLNM